jgi:uncharacterized protein YggU (UPF0235/DUF167 family)
MARISIWVRPGATTDSLAWDPWRKRWAVSCRAPPTNGEANRAVADLVAVWLGVPRTRVRWEKAGTSRAKTIQVVGMSELDAAERLRKRSTADSSANPSARP